MAWLSKRPDRSAEWLKAKLNEGFHIHHIDCDANNNEPDNLILVEGKDHLALHNKSPNLADHIEQHERLSGKTQDSAMIIYWLRSLGWSPTLTAHYVIQQKLHPPAIIETLTNKARAFARQENLEWPLPICTGNIFYKKWVGRRPNYASGLALDPLPLPSGESLTLQSMLTPISDWPWPSKEKHRT